MENRLLMSLTALLLIDVGLGITTPNPTNISATDGTKETSITPTPPTVPQTTRQGDIKYIALTEIALLKVKRKSPCEGPVYVYSATLGEKPLCLNEKAVSLLSGLCKDMRCGNSKHVTTFYETDSGIQLASNMTLTITPCSGLSISCTDPLGNELIAYKAVTGILFFILLVILVQFSRPTIKVIRKRFSQKRQSRWIGPTQSQSVSYHRGQGGPNNNTVKRQSYPGLERLTVNTSREPSSNRNSDYDSYSYN
ncbi:T-cell surface glycoprotein CD5 [Danio aesculapii]|uniref:T-cell surface glycoprotein CD5 n=1 Tax=Danio aesculapii TaxID=1142201 RepID=UPI0024BF2EDA|nr:T-cell surface glycoprotein CD5 [Danio aesculapii]